MINYLQLTNCPLFMNISIEDIAKICECFKSTIKQYKKNEIIYSAGDKVNSLGIILSGRVHLTKYDLFGNAHIINSFNKNQIFAETYSCQQNVNLPLNVISAEDTQILFIETKKIYSICPSRCECHQQLFQNLLFISLNKNIKLIEKIEHISPKNTRQRVLNFLQSQYYQKNSYSFYIPYNRQQLADYLLVDRSALSAELAKMQKDGLIKYKKNYFEIISNQ